MAIVEPKNLSHLEECLELVFIYFLHFFTVTCFELPVERNKDKHSLFGDIFDLMIEVKINVEKFKSLCIDVKYVYISNFYKTDHYVPHANF